jgi:hypothetical protein
MRRALAIAAVVVGAGVVAGCGASASERDVSEVVERFQAALAGDDGRAACAQLTTATRDAIESDEEAPCAEAVLELDLPVGGTVSSSEVYELSAIAELDDGAAAFLDQTPDGWRIGAAGCTPTEPNMPYDCELER